jgi:hypothetical protein
LRSRHLTVLLTLLTAGITLACSCLPLSSLEWMLESRQPDEPVTDVPWYKQSDPDLVACDENLAELLWLAEDYDLPGTELPFEYTLATYPVRGDNLAEPDLPSVPQSVRAFQEDASLHQEMWDLIVDTVPATYRSEVDYFEVFTDGPGGMLGAVEQVDRPGIWVMELDAQDAGHFPDLATTLIHELFHIMSLNASQVEPNHEVFDHPDDPALYARREAACQTYFLFEGCARPDSYLNLFLERFWQDLYPEWVQIYQGQSEQALEQDIYEFYSRYPQEFVSSYAATSLEEDLAESFMYFVLAPMPAGDTPAEEKILFFYEYPDLVSLREQMRQGLCPYIQP